MMKLICFCVSIISLVMASCTNNTDAGDKEVFDEEKELRYLITKYPDSLLLKENLVQYFRDQGNYGQAIMEATTVLKKDSLNARFLNIKATLHFENGDTLNAIKAFEQATSIDPKPASIISLGSLYAQTKNARALDIAEALLSHPEYNAQKEAIFIKGLYFSYSGDKEKAIGYFDNCLKIDYRNVLAYREKAICLYDLNKFDSALNVLQTALSVQNTFDEGYYWMGRCYERLGKNTEATNSYEAALQIDPNYIEAKEALARKKLSLEHL